MGLQDWTQQTAQESMIVFAGEADWTPRLEINDGGGDEVPTQYVAIVDGAESDDDPVASAIFFPFYLMKYTSGGDTLHRIAQLAVQNPIYARNLVKLLCCFAEARWYIQDILEYASITPHLSADSRQILTDGVNDYRNYFGGMK